jgi:hypothetical protein
LFRRYWHASQAPGFSSEQDTAEAEAIAGADLAVTVVFAIRVAGRERK